MKIRCAELLAACAALAAGAALAQVDPSPARVARDNPAVLGAAPSVPALPTAQLAPAGRWTAVQLQQAFQTADSDGNGELSRAEAQRLQILPRSFEELDANKDGVLSRDEYGALR